MVHALPQPEAHRRDCLTDLGALWVPRAWGWSLGTLLRLHLTSPVAFGMHGLHDLRTPTALPHLWHT